MKIHIASPSYDGYVRKEYMRSVVVLMEYFRQAGIQWHMALENSTLLHLNRSLMASAAMLDEACTHLLFIDTDMGFEPSAVQKMLAADKDVVGVAYPYRALPRDAKPLPDRSFAQSVSESATYALRPVAGKLAVQGSLCEVDAIGTGLLLVSTGALRKLAPKVRRYRQVVHHEFYKHDHYYGFFDYVVLDDATLTEDYSFCHRWRHDCGGRIHAVVDEMVSHTGALSIHGRFIDRLKAGRG
jgi:hypothetical protein